MARDRSCSHVAHAEVAFDVGDRRQRSELSLDCHQPRAEKGGGVMGLCESWERERGDLKLIHWLGWIRFGASSSGWLGEVIGARWPFPRSLTLVVHELRETEEICRGRQSSSFS